MLVDDEDKLLRELDMLKQEHHSLDELINQATIQPHAYDQLTLQRLKKRKLWLKDRITQLEAVLYPDIIA